ncbi:MAG: glucosaminidase domain-containing protein [Alistipes sp.]|nr:glucosaminidase domain-containing protein [Alistipes sp.]
MKNFRFTIVYLFLAILPSVYLTAQTRQTREEYIEKYKAIAVAHMERYGIPASITMAQGILESDAGNSKLSLSSNNHFGIKCKKHWTGAKVYHDDDAKGECFRAYPTVEESYQDHAEFLDSSPRYDSLFAYPSDDYRSWARGLKAAGYATAPDYAQRLVSIIEKYKLYLLDREDGAAIYSSGKTAKENAEWFANQSNTQIEADPSAPDPFRVTINPHDGYGIYRINKTCYVRAKEGDSYQSIGKAFDIAEHTLRKFNDVDRQAKLAEGDIVYIERKKSHWLGDAHIHTTRKGESLHSVSQSYGIRLSRLARLSRLNPTRPISEGQMLRLK